MFPLLKLFARVFKLCCKVSFLMLAFSNFIGLIIMGIALVLPACVSFLCHPIPIPFLDIVFFHSFFSIEILQIHFFPKVRFGGLCHSFVKMFSISTASSSTMIHLLVCSSVNEN